MEPQRLLKCMLLSEGSQLKKATSCVTPTNEILEKAKRWRQQKDPGAEGNGAGKGRAPRGSGAVQLLRVSLSWC